MSDDLTPATAAEALRRGEPVDLSGGALTAAELRDLLDDPEADPATELRLHGATVTGALDLSDAEVRRPVRLSRCTFTGPVDLSGARLHRLDLTGSAFPALAAAAAVVDGDLLLTDCRMDGELTLAGARIAGTARLERTELRNPGNTALRAVGLSVGTALHCCTGFRCAGKIDLSFAEVPGQVCFADATLSHPGGVALVARHLSTAELVLATAGPIEGDVLLQHAKIGLLRETPAAGNPPAPRSGAGRGPFRRLWGRRPAR